MMNDTRQEQPDSPPSQEEQAQPGGVAIIGVSGRFPGAASVSQFWSNLKQGLESIQTFTDTELLEAGVAAADLANPNYVSRYGFLDGTYNFDADFFGYTRSEAEITDPQHRIFMECAWEALEDAAYAGEEHDGKVGVFAGAGFSAYLIKNLLSNQDLVREMGSLQAIIGNKADFLPSKVSYKFNLKGPSINVNSACATSLVAVHIACQSLLSYESDMALAGGVTVFSADKGGYLYQPGGVYSPDGQCRAFDARAQGTVGGNGVGVVLLKRYDEALRDGDAIYAVILGSAVNNDGAAKVGYTAPGIEGQKEVIATALALAEVSAESIGYVEAHGTATTMGDPIEMRALTEAFRHDTARNRFCAIGSVKTNIGHLDSAAGAAGLIKAALCLHHQTLVPSLNYEAPNPNIDFANSPFFVNTETRAWQPDTPGMPLRAGVSSFGVGGTNAHAILQQVPPAESSATAKGELALMLSARSQIALEAAQQRLQDYLEQHPNCNLADVAWSLQIGRKHFRHRRVILARDVAQALQVLGTGDQQRILNAELTQAPSGVVFMFPGIGDQYLGMGDALYRQESVYRSAIDRCAAILHPMLDLDLRDVLYPQRLQAEMVPEQAAGTGVDLRAILNRMRQAGAPAGVADDAEQQALTRTRIAHPALFAVEYALAQQWLAWIGTPGALIGHSLGEYVAACIAGVMSLEDALTVVAGRARIIDQLPQGRMLAVALPQAALAPLLTPELSQAALNSPLMSVLAGTTQAVAALEVCLQQQGVAFLPVASSHAFHSHMMQAAAQPLAALLKTVTLNRPKIPYLSNLTGDWITAAQATDPDYWVQHTLQPVQFGAGIAKLAARDEPSLFLELGAGQTLSSFVQQQSSATSAASSLQACTSLPGPHERGNARFVILRALASAWCTGQKVDWAAYYQDERRRRLSLPTYPFQRQPYLVQPKAGDLLSSPAIAPSTDNPVRAWQAQWQSEVPPGSIQSRDSSLSPSSAPQQERLLLLFENDDAFAVQLNACLPCPAVRVRRGVHYERLGRHEFRLDPKTPAHFSSLFQALAQDACLPQQIVYLWGMQAILSDAYCGLQNLLVAAGSLLKAPAGVALVTDQLFDVCGLEQLQSAQGALPGLARCAALEYPLLRLAHIDLMAQATAAPLLYELALDLPQALVAWRGKRRWSRHFVPLDSLLEGRHRNTTWPAVATVLISGYDGQALSRLAAQVALRAGTIRLLLWIGDSAVEAADFDSGIQALAQPGVAISVLRGKDGPLISQLSAVLAQADRIDLCLHLPCAVEDALLQGNDGVSMPPLEAEIQRVGELLAQLQARPTGALVLLGSALAYTATVGRAAQCALAGMMQAYAEQTAMQAGFPVSALALDLQDDAQHARSLQSLPKGLQAMLVTSRRRFSCEPGLAAKALLEYLHTGIGSALLHTNDVNALLNAAQADNLTHLLAQVNVRSAGANPGGRGLRAPYVAPESDFEISIAEIWCNLFGVDDIGADDSFFGLGGSSLMAVQFFTRLRETYQVEWTLKALFETPVLRQLAQQVEDVLMARLENMSDDEAAQYLADDMPSMDQNRSANAAQAAPMVEASACVLPNGLVVQHFNQVETDHFYQDIFEHKVYAKNGIRFRDGAVVFDVGSNIGLFSLFANLQSKGVTVFAFEPAPPVFEVLQRNIHANGVQSRLFNCGVSDRARREKLTFYPHSTGMSSFHADKEEEKQVLQAIMQNQLEQGVAGMREVMAYADQILEQRFRETSFDCDMVTISGIMHQHEVPHIDLLKIDVQKAEFEVLLGIDDSHWPKIAQIVIEVHDIDQRVDKVRRLLCERGFRVIVEQDELYRGSNISNLYALRA